jgi:cell division GTPase FtsZ
MSRAKNVTPELVMEQETISAAMEMAKPTVCVIGAGGAGSKTLSRGLRARAS